MAPTRNCRARFLDDRQGRAGSSLFVIKRAGKYAIRAARIPRANTAANSTASNTYPAKEEYTRDRPMGGGAAEDSRSSTSWARPSDGQPRLRGVPTSRQGVPALSDLRRARTRKSCSISSATRPAAKETYGAGRFLYSAMPEDGQVVLDFKRPTTRPARSRPTPPVRCRPRRINWRCASKPAKRATTSPLTEPRPEGSGPARLHARGSVVRRRYACANPRNCSSPQSTCPWLADCGRVRPSTPRFSRSRRDAA